MRMINNILFRTCGRVFTLTFILKHLVFSLDVACFVLWFFEDDDYYSLPARNTFEYILLASTISIYIMVFGVMMALSLCANVKASTHKAIILAEICTFVIITSISLVNCLFLMPWLQPKLIAITIMLCIINGLLCCDYVLISYRKKRKGRLPDCV